VCVCACHAVLFGGSIPILHTNLLSPLSVFHIPCLVYGLDDRQIGIGFPLGVRDFSRKCPEWLRGPSSLLFTGYWGLLSGVTRLKREVGQCKGGVELYLHFAEGVYGVQKVDFSFYPDHGGRTFLCNVGAQLTDCRALYYRRQESLWSPP
jgi:hypothetical protein